MVTLSYTPKEGGGLLHLPCGNGAVKFGGVELLFGQVKIGHKKALYRTGKGP